MTLRGKQRRYLRGLGHGLDPVVLLGKEGLTDGVVGALGEALETHELVKVKFGQNFPEDKQASAEEAARRAGAELVQVLGSTALLYRARLEEPSIKLPKLPR
jgi:RNA-binding protein